MTQKLQATLKQHSLYGGDLIHNPQFSDVTLVSSDDKIIEAHRFVLYSHSSFFKRIFQHKPARDIVICLANITREQLQSMIEYMYLGNTEIHEDNLQNFV